MAKLVPWSEFEANYSSNFAPIMGPPAKSFRIALGALIIKEKLELTDPRNSTANQRKPLFTILDRLK